MTYCGLSQVAKSLAKASAETDQLKQRIASLEKELASAKEQKEKLQVRCCPTYTGFVISYLPDSIQFCPCKLHPLS